MASSSSSSPFSTHTNILYNSQLPNYTRPRFHNAINFKTQQQFLIKNKPILYRNTSLRRMTAASPQNPEVTELTSTQTTSNSKSKVHQGWKEFSERVSGEWDGFGADFTVDGNPIELPESVVPDAYREWEVKVFDWQTQCPTLGEFNHNTPSILYKNIKLFPTVGCEADAATRHSIQERITTSPHHYPFAYQSSGCYVALWPVNDNNNNKLFELEHCLIDPRDKESRVRIIQVLDEHLILKGIKVFVEQWYGPFRNGDQLGGCSIRDSAFAVTQPLDAKRVTGVWQGVNAVANFDTHSKNMIRQLEDEGVCQSTRDEGDLIVLPKHLWCSVKGNGEDIKETYCEVGWLLDEGQAITSKCTFSSNAEMKVISIAKESAIPTLV